MLLNPLKQVVFLMLFNLNWGGMSRCYLFSILRVTGPIVHYVWNDVCVAIWYFTALQ